MKPFPTLFVFVLFAVACAAGPRRVSGYQQASAVPMRPPARGPGPSAAPVPSYPSYHTPGSQGVPGAGAPTYGQPIQPSVHRSKNWRDGGPVPALMAPDDAPRAARLEARKLYREYLRDLPGVADPEALALECASSMTRALGHFPDLLKAMEDKELEHSFNQGACLSGRLYQLCVEMKREAVQEATRAEVARLREARCRFGNSPEVEAIVMAVRRQLLH